MPSLPRFTLGPSARSSPGAPLAPAPRERRPFPRGRLFGGGPPGCPAACEKNARGIAGFAAASAKTPLGRPAVQDCLANCCAALWPAAEACPVGCVKRTVKPGYHSRCVSRTLQGAFHAVRRHAPAGPDMGPARTPSHPAALTSCIRGPPAPTPQCRTQLARTQLPCERRRDACPGPGFTPGQPAHKVRLLPWGEPKGGLNRAPARANPHRIPQRRVTLESILGNGGARFNASFQAKFGFSFLGGCAKGREDGAIRKRENKERIRHPFFARGSRRDRPRPLLRLHSPRQVRSRSWGSSSPSAECAAKYGCLISSARCLPRNPQEAEGRARRQSVLRG